MPDAFPTHLDRPNPETLMPGDILLPRRMDVMVPFNHPVPPATMQTLGGGGDVKAVLRRTALEGLFESALDVLALLGVSGLDLLDELLKAAGADGDILEIIKYLLDRAKNGTSGGAIDQAILAGFYSGHSAMVMEPHPQTNEPWIIEASHTHGGVRAVSYADWLAERMGKANDGQPKPKIWHARITNADGTDLSAKDRAEICTQAHRLRMLGKRYQIFDRPVAGVKGQGILNMAPLGDENYVYCSEFIYICALKGAGIDLAADTRGDLIVTLFPFLGPKQLSRSSRLRWLNKPEDRNYGDRPAT